MKNLLIILVAVFGFVADSAAQKFFTKTGTISFSAGTSVEDIDATNKAATSVYDASSGQIEFAVLMKGFEFKRDLMQQHFNENYVESEKYPKAVFKGKIAGTGLDVTKDGQYAVTVSGTLDLHGVSKEVTASGTFDVKGGVIGATAEFVIALADYKIEIPGAVADKISPTVKVKVLCNYKPLVK